VNDQIEKLNPDRVVSKRKEDVTPKNRDSSAKEESSLWALVNQSLPIYSSKLLFLEHHFPNNYLGLRHKFILMRW